MFRSVSPETVRAYFASQGTPIASTGRISDADTKVYNKANPGKRYQPAGYAGKTFKVTAKPAKGRSVTKVIVEREARAAALAAGVPVGERGALPKAVREAYVLGTLSSLVPQDA
jgi:hypothetical protein